MILKDFYTPARDFDPLNLFNPFGGEAVFAPVPTLLKEKWNYPTGDLNVNAPWSGANVVVKVVQNQYVRLPDVIGGTSGSASPTTSPAYLPNKAHSIECDLYSFNSGTVTVALDNGLASAVSMNYTNGGANSTIRFNGGGIGSDANITDTTLPGSAGGLLLAHIKLSIGAPNPVDRTAVLKVTILGVVHTYTRNVKAPTNNTAQNFSFTVLSNLADSGTDLLRIGPITVKGFQT